MQEGLRGRPEVPPDLIQSLDGGVGRSRVLTVGVQFGVWSHIAAGATTAAAIAQRAQASERGIRMLLDALVSLQLLTKAQDTYALTPVAAEFLVRDRPFYMGQLMEGDWMWEPWGHLAEAVRTGQPFRPVDRAPAAAEPFFRAYIPVLYVLNLPGARQVAEVLVGRGVPAGGLRVLDLGCGSAVWSIAVAEAAGPTTRVTAQDLPGVLEVTRTYVQRHGVEAQYAFLPGDQRQVPLGTQQFDLAILARYVHELGAQEACDLFRRVWVALTPGGRIAVVDWMPNEERTAPAGPLLAAVRMLLHTEEGDAHTATTYTRWLGSVGFTHLAIHPDIGTDGTLIVGVKP
jgi:SAM-dependent methyltransferase